MTMSSSQHGTVFKNQKKITIALLCLAGMLIIGDLDYMTGYKTSVIVVYLLPIGFAAIEVGPAFAILVAVLSVVISITTDLWVGLPSSEMPTKILNSSIALTVFIISVGLLRALKRILLQREP